MRTRIIALVVAIALAIAGGVLLVNYVRGADQRASEGAELTPVLVVTDTVPQGTLASELELFVEQREVPAAFRAEGAFTSVDELAEVADLVTTAALVSGEQLVRERFASPESLVESGGSVQIPEGLQEVTVSLEAPRILGGRIAAGDSVGVYVSVESDGANPRQTRPLLEQVLVTAVSGGQAVSADGTISAGNTVTVTLAVSEVDAQAIIYAREYAQLWFTKQNEETTPSTNTPFTLQELLT
ncbi:pilus assembly protein CpaB [Microbacteriaceae bacterium SG_E_30_P1]|uniref:Pilus assembly protein CpaB n=1 Tax=Antiquaquibacter oligotrophicus TaxID=2880260 RepID=A0ABT6KSX0_9MICO|nr:Flp pilus assembly protein CpaB [Antiquaquibacter oligotrophicus]MDH6182297.1 pilus assembly protein CpaB [Antiquaquibacter oligotrophicus]UDF12047.1 Flp pilus assembly protein CpaB [Antiquaquibacter oligotrophicus]